MPPTRPRPRPRSGESSRGPALLVVAAYPPELAGLAPGLPDHAAALTTAAVGIGAVEAAAGAARVLAAIRPQRVVLVGTAGCYPATGGSARLRWPIGAAVVIRRAALASLAVAGGKAYLPSVMPDHADSDPRLRRAIAAAARLPVGDSACPLGITRTAGAARALRDSTGADLENLEAFAVARAAAAAGIPFAAVLGIANEVGPRAHVQWRANGTAAADAACAAVLRLLDAEAASTVRAPSRRRSPRR